MHGELSIKFIHRVIGSRDTSCKPDCNMMYELNATAVLAGLVVCLHDSPFVPVPFIRPVKTIFHIFTSIALTSDV
jgi:hypothetical protein